MRHDVLKFIQTLEPDIGHADFLSLIDKGRAALQHIHGRQHFPAFHAVLLAAVAADDARMVMVLNIQRIPRFALQLFLPVRKGTLHLAQVERRLDHVRHKAVRLHVREGDHLVQDLIRSLRDIGQRDLRSGHRAFADGEAVIVIQDIAAEFLQITVGLRLVGIILDAVGNRHLRIRVRQSRCLADIGDDILAEPVHAHIQPEAQNPLDLFADPGVGHVQVRLLFREEMQIVFIQVLIIFPGIALEHAGPVVRRNLLPPAVFPAAPDIVVVIGVVA